MAKQNLQCPYCPKTSSRGTGLASHIRGAHPAEYADWSLRRKGGPIAAISKPGNSRKPGRPGKKGKGGMGSGLKDIVAQLERQMAAIDRALSALRAVEGFAEPGDATVSTSTVSNSGESAARGPSKRRRKRVMTPEGRARLVAALKKRWAAKKASGG